MFSLCPHAFRQSYPCLDVCCMSVCVFLPQPQCPSKAPPPHSTYLLPPGSISILVLCDTFHPPVALLFHSPPCFPLSCLPLVFFPVCLSPDNSPLSKLFYVTPSQPLSGPFFAPPPVNVIPCPFPFCCISFSHTLLSLSQGQRRGLN